MAFPCATPTPILPGAQPPPTQLPPPQLPPINLGEFLAVPPEPPTPPPPPVPAAVAPRFVSDLRLSSTWVLYWLATLVRASYSPETSLITRAAGAVLPADYPVTVTPNGAGLVPGWTVIKMPKGAIVIISGTTNLPQWLDQTLNSYPITWTKLTPPGTRDGIRTLQIYATAAQTIWADLAVKVPLDEQILFVGHSMGGAIAELLHAVAAAGDNGRVPSRCVTFASPKPGDSRRAALTRTNGQVYRRLIINNDFIPGLPPNLSAINLLIPGPLQAASAGWSLFQHADTPTVVSLNGDLSDGADPVLVIQIGQALLAAAVGNPLAPVASHYMDAYVSRLYRAIDRGVESTPEDWQSPNDLLTINGQLTTADF